MEVTVGDRVKVQKVDGETRNPWGSVHVVERRRVLVRFGDGHEEWVDRFAIIETRKA